MTASTVNQYYGRSGLMERIKESFAAAGKDFNDLSVDDLAPIDEFHTRGRESTTELATMAASPLCELITAEVDEPLIVSNVCRALGEIRDAKAVPTLVKLLSSQEPGFLLVE